MASGDHLDDFLSDLEANVPLSMALPDDPGASEDQERALPGTPGQSLAAADAEVHRLMAMPMDSHTAEDLAAVNAYLASRYEVKAKAYAHQAMDERAKNYMTMPGDQKLDFMKTMAQHGRLLPKEEKVSALPFNLVIDMSGVVASQAKPVTIENGAD